VLISFLITLYDNTGRIITLSREVLAHFPVVFYWFLIGK
jgi:hypothetical protein